MATSEQVQQNALDQLRLGGTDKAVSSAPPVAEISVSGMPVGEEKHGWYLPLQILLWIVVVLLLIGGAASLMSYIRQGNRADMLRGACCKNGQVTWKKKGNCSGEFSFRGFPANSLCSSDKVSYSATDPVRPERPIEGQPGVDGTYMPDGFVVSANYRDDVDEVEDDDRRR